jgi:hypothetical protein
VRVLSDGDNESAAQEGSQGEQSTDGSAGAAQTGSAEANAPVRVLSDGDNEGDAQAEGGSQSADESTGSVQAGPAEANAPVRVLSDGDNKTGGAGVDGGSPPGADTPDEPGQGPAGAVEDGNGAQPDGLGPGAGVEAASASAPSERGPAGVRFAGIDGLPFTGLAVYLLLVIGAWALGGGLCLRRLLGLREVRIRAL